MKLKFAINLFMLIAMETSATAKPILNYLVREPKVKTENPSLIILLHRAGSNERDLFSFANKLPENFLVISERGPIAYGPSRYPGIM